MLFSTWMIYMMPFLTLHVGNIPLSSTAFFPDKLVSPTWILLSQYVLLCQTIIMWEDVLLTVHHPRHFNWWDEVCLPCLSAWYRGFSPLCCGGWFPTAGGNVWHPKRPAAGLLWPLQGWKSWPASQLAQTRRASSFWGVDDDAAAVW